MHKHYEVIVPLERHIVTSNIVFSQVRKIPQTFLSARDYMNSFIPSLIEETHTELSSSVTSVSAAPFCEIMRVEMSRNFNPTKGLFYQIALKRTTNGVKDVVGTYKPEAGDLIAFTDTKPKGIYDLNSPKRGYHIAYVHGSKDESSGMIPILSSKRMDMEIISDLRSNNSRKLYAVYLFNMTTNVRIWKALNTELEDANMNLIKKVLQADSNVRITKSIQY